MRDAEVLEMLGSLLDELGVKGWRLEVNSVGSATDRPRYIAALREALAPVKDAMCEDNRRRAETNPLRVLDSKAPEDQATIDALPKIADYLDEASTEHFKQVLAALDACGVAYHVNPRLVRGLDYYTRTTFEFTVPDGSGLGTQNALLGGGRYDGLSEMLGGPKAPGIGFAIGEDRLILTLQAQLGESVATKLDAFIAPIGAHLNAHALRLARELRRSKLSIEVGDGSSRLKKNFDFAEKVAGAVILVGDEEIENDSYKVKTFLTGRQNVVARDQLVNWLISARSITLDRASATEKLRYQFWSELLSLALEDNVRHHAKRQPTTSGLIAERAATEHGIQLRYRILSKLASVDLYIDTRNINRNSDIFKALLADKSEIETLVGHPLKWDHMDGSRAFRVRQEILSGGLGNREVWGATQREMITAMSRFVSTFVPRLRST